MPNEGGVAAVGGEAGPGHRQPVLRAGPVAGPAAVSELHWDDLQLPLVDRLQGVQHLRRRLHHTAITDSTFTYSKDQT